MKKNLFVKVNILSVLVRVSMLGAIACITALIFFQSLDSAVNIPTFHLDGAFQSASGLFRLDSGQVPGRDFYPYLGVGPILLIFPFFELAGGTLAASSFATHFVTMSLAWITFSVLWQLIFRPKSIIYSYIGGATIFLAIDLLSEQLSLPSIYLFGFEPGNSLRPVRAALPYFIAIITYLLLSHFKVGPKRDILAGLLIGISLLWSNDFALPTAGIFTIFYFLLFYSKERVTWKKSAITFSLSAFISWSFLLSVVTLGHPFELIKYNFIDVATDQWWYFGPYAAKNRVFEIDQIFKIFSAKNYFPLTVLLTASVFAIKTKKLEHVLIFLIGLILFAGGSLASLGGHIGGYYSVFFYWATITVTLAVLRGFQLLVYNQLVLNSKDSSRIDLWLVGLSFFFLLIGTSNKFTGYKETESNAQNDPGKYYIPELGGYLGIEWKNYIDYARKHKESKTTEDYWGIWSSLNRNFPPWPVDAAIHALGEARESSKLALPNSDVIISTRYSTSATWQPWNFSQNFWFYEELVLNWVPDFISPTSIVWKKAQKSRENKKVNCHTSDSQESFSLDAKALGFYKVTLNYQSSGPGRYLLLVQNNISYVSGAHGQVSIPLHGPEITIPTLITKDSGNVFKTEIIGSDDVKLKITSCYAETISYENDEMVRRTLEDDAIVAKSNRRAWKKRQKRHGSGFFIPNQASYIDKYKAGKYVFFPNMDFRKILSVEPKEPFPYIRVEGPALTPSAIEVITNLQVVDIPKVTNHVISEGFYFTDQHWIKGIAKNQARFFLPNTYYYSTKFEVGKYVIFKNGETRKIKTITPSDKYLFINVEGMPLNPSEIGMPSEYSILEN